MTGFSIGDRVVTKLHEGLDFKYCIWPVGSYGTVVIDGDDTMIGVAFDTLNRNGHSLNGACQDDYGYFVFPEELDLVEKASLEELPDISTDNLKLLFG